MKFGSPSLVTIKGIHKSHQAQPLSRLSRLSRLNAAPGGRSRAPRAVPYRGSCTILPPDSDIDIVLFGCIQPGLPRSMATLSEILARHGGDRLAARPGLRAFYGKT